MILMRGQIVIPFLFFIIIGIITAILAVYIVYGGFNKSISTASQSFSISSISINNEITYIYGNFNLSKISNIEITTDANSININSSYFEKSTYISSNNYENKINKNLTSLLFTNGFPNYIKYIYIVYNGKIYDANLLQSYASLINSSKIYFNEINLSNYDVAPNSQITITSNTNILSPIFIYYLNKNQLVNCSTNTCTFIAPNKTSTNNVTVIVSNSTTSESSTTYFYVE